ncbi:hypothetical protein DFH07DRAFT_796517 [Mycena maculata]|uniref:Uncharacterized protein n=1 Tax=Mycena maculata TaxID=230809 RepID=A0AAD7NVP3_9AGAR|nr:hypothetical protein DFH07DRAFT_796517 [Mycena maculata]
MRGWVWVLAQGVSFVCFCVLWGWRARERGRGFCVAGIYSSRDGSRCARQGRGRERGVCVAVGADAGQSAGCVLARAPLIQRRRFTYLLHGH